MKRLDILLKSEVDSLELTKTAGERRALSQSEVGRRCCSELESHKSRNQQEDKDFPHLFSIRCFCCVISTGCHYKGR